jgi:hypothetical protein
MNTDDPHADNFVPRRGIIFAGLTSESPLADIIAAAERAATANAEGDIAETEGNPLFLDAVDRTVHADWLRYDIHDLNVLDGLAVADRERVERAAWDARQVALHKAGAR